MALIGLVVVLLLVIIGDNGGQAQVSQGGPCENAREGQLWGKCEITCNFDGSCEESHSTEECCNGEAYTTHIRNDYLDGQHVGGVGRRKKRQAENICDNVPRKCSQCFGRSRWTAQAKGSESSTDCPGNQRRNGQGNQGSTGTSGSGGAGGGNRAPSCGGRGGDIINQGDCIYECNGDIRGLGTCMTEKRGTCGSCFGERWGGSCSGEPRGCSSCKDVC